jgi:(p)ppGpp synthase/HD superfamily hydrolase
VAARALLTCSRPADFQRGGRTASEVYDVLGLRIIVAATAASSLTSVDMEEACLHVEEVVNSLFKPVRHRRKDYISSPKANGYQSLHFAVQATSNHLSGATGRFELHTGAEGTAAVVETVEVQVRSDDMHVAAEHGASSHFAYKGGLDRVQTHHLQDWTKELMRVRPLGFSIL